MFDDLIGWAVNILLFVFLASMFITTIWMLIVFVVVPLLLIVAASFIAGRITGSEWAGILVFLALLILYIIWVYNNW